MKILVVEDDPAIQRLLSRGLEGAGHEVVIAGDGEDALTLAADEAIELVILDLGLPDMEGQSVLRHLRARRPGVPVLVLTARDDVGQKVQALDGGADDYMTKPFAFQELLARIRALTRRADQPSSTRLESGDVRLDLLARRAWRDDREIELSAREFALLEYLMRHANQVLSRTQILMAVWEYDADPTSNVVDVYIRYLRRKLSPQDEPSPITTVRGMGYRFEGSAPALTDRRRA
ncbi:MAG TPA: response regulator transcription factor [Candidatus Limnocylindria bacterium]|nr:response regulator transcription factor [Candidatus Limnocylindria bacterium]